MIRNFFIKVLNRYASKWVVLFIDIVLVCISFIAAYSIRFNISLDFDTSILIKQIPLVALFSFFSFLIVGSYKGIIRHTGTKDAFNVFIGVSIFSSIIAFLVIVNQLFIFKKVYIIPKSIILIHYLVSIFVLILSRYIFKAFYEVISSEIKTITNALIYGAGESGIITYSAINRDKNNRYQILGFMDDDINKINKKIDRIRIYNSLKIDDSFIKKNNINEVIISIENIKSSRLLEITDRLINLDVEVKIVPPLSKWIGGDLEVNQIKQINIDDLLDRAPIKIDNPIVQREVDGKQVQ